MQRSSHLYMASDMIIITSWIARASAVIAGVYGAGRSVELDRQGSPRFAVLRVPGREGVDVFVGIPRLHSGVHVTVISTEDDEPKAQLVADALGVDLNTTVFFDTVVRQEA